MAGLVTTGGKVRAVFVSSSAPFIPADLVFAKPPKLQVRRGKSIMLHILNKRLKLETCTVCVFPVITYFSQADRTFFIFTTHLVADRMLYGCFSVVNGPFFPPLIFNHIYSPGAETDVSFWRIKSCYFFKSVFYFLIK